MRKFEDVMKSPRLSVIHSAENKWLTATLTHPEYKPNQICIIAAWNEVAIDGKPLEHVSVSLARRCPTWDEMSMIKDIFWEDEECVIQFHPPKSEYINWHPYCLHMWRKPGWEPELIW